MCAVAEAGHPVLRSLRSPARTYRGDIPGTGPGPLAGRKRGAVVAEQAQGSFYEDDGAILLIDL